MEILRRVGAARNTPHLRRGMLGISLSNHFFSKAHVGQIAQIGVRECDEFLIILVDWPERWNWPLKPGATYETNKPNVIKLSIERQRGFLSALRQVSLNDAVSVLDWKTAVGESPEYLRNLKVVENAYTTDNDFRTAVELQVQENLGSRIAERKSQFSLVHEEIVSLSHYMMEEIAGLYTLWFDDGYVDFYHKPTATIDKRIFSGEFSCVSDVLPYDWSQYGLVQVD
jgi:tRNA-dependent cyclodipeptide synthase